MLSYIGRHVVYTPASIEPVRFLELIRHTKMTVCVCAMRLNTVRGSECSSMHTAVCVSVHSRSGFERYVHSNPILFIRSRKPNGVYVRIFAVVVVRSVAAFNRLLRAPHMRTFFQLIHLAYCSFSLDFYSMWKSCLPCHSFECECMRQIERERWTESGEDESNSRMRKAFFICAPFPWHPIGPVRCNVFSVVFRHAFCSFEFSFESFFSSSSRRLPFFVS